VNSRKLQSVVAGLGLLYFALLVGTNLGCAPKYFLRADVLAGMAVTICALGLLAFALRGEDDARRIAGIAGCGLLAGLWAQPDFTILAAPVAVAGCLRLPRRELFVPALVVAALAPIVGHVLPDIGTFLLTPDQFRCP
jgi:hypothetical protein